MAFQKGKSGNPTGKPKQKALSDALMLALKRVDRDNRPAIQRIANKLVDLAEEGDLAAIRECFDRTEGKAMQAMSVSGDEDAPLQIIRRLVVDPKGSE